jgi:hypothetical protein
MLSYQNDRSPRITRFAVRKIWPLASRPSPFLAIILLF